jgi:hypothetical protein
MWVCHSQNVTSDILFGVCCIWILILCLSFLIQFLFFILTLLASLFDVEILTVKIETNNKYITKSDESFHYHVLL